MNDPDDFDALLRQRFDREHPHVPAEPFVAGTLQKIRVERRRTATVRTLLRAAVMVALVIASPWLIAGATYLNAALESSFRWSSGLPGAWILGALAVVAVLAFRLRSR